MTAIMQTTYRDDRDASRLLKYIQRDTPLRNRFGEEMSDQEIETFIERSKRHEFERDIILSPENGNDLSSEEFSLHTRQVMGEFLEGRPTATYCYALHRDTDHPHVHVALTGARRDLYMNREDIAEVRERTNERMVERRREHTQTIDQVLEEAQARERAELQQEQEQDHERNHDRDNDRGGWSR